MKKEECKDKIIEEYGLTEEQFQEAKGCCLNHLDKAIEQLRFLRGEVALGVFVKQEDIDEFNKCFFGGEDSLEENSIDCLDIFVAK